MTSQYPAGPPPAMHPMDRPRAEGGPMSFPDRHEGALAIVDPGASNPAGVALAIHQACSQVIHEGGNQREDAAVRLMTTQLAFLVQGNSDLDPAEYGRLMDACRARAAERRNAPKPATDAPA